jgi:DNA-binding response OmpR family regulator
MTELAETEHVVRGLEAGGVDCVTKPIVIVEMLARIRVHLKNARLSQSARAALDVSSGRYLFAVKRSDFEPRSTHRCRCSRQTAYAR